MLLANVSQLNLHVQKHDIIDHRRIIILYKITDYCKSFVAIITRKFSQTVRDARGGLFH
jgi:hypothetical protein